MPEYHRAARFPDESTSEHAYGHVRRLLHDNEWELSAFRTLLLPEVLWYVLVLGRTPSEEFQEQIATAVATGEEVILPEEVLIAFNRRRIEQITNGPWVERRMGRRRL